MCWIFWYKGKTKNAYNVLMHWLQKLEYRWYDSAGLAVWTDDWNFKIVKSVWKVSFLMEKVINEFKNDDKHYNYGIAHTRWATHWWVTEENTHPHFDTKEKIYIVHNWIIENCDELKSQLEEKWYKFYSQTDTEIVAKLLEDNWTWDLLESVELVLPMLEWAYAFLIINKSKPWEIIWVRYWSPLILWESDWEFYFSSDINALAWYTDNVVFLNDWDLVYIKWEDYIIKSEWKLIKKPTEKVDLTNIKIDKWNFQHYMLKEIWEQADILSKVFKWRIDRDSKVLTWDVFRELDKYDFEKVIFVACGTSYNAGVLWTYRFQELANMDSRAEIASEFEYKNMLVDEKTLYIFISQSWETADTIECINQVKNKWWKTLWIVNVVWSTISRITDFGMFTRAWTEVWVASTKAFVSQISVIILLVLYFAKKRWMNLSIYEKILNNLFWIEDLITQILSMSHEIQKIWENISSYKNMFFLWKNVQFPIAMESSLKCKEISYIHSESYSSWELKHWPLALIDKDFLTVLFMPNDLLFDKNMLSFKEIKARNWKIVVISDNIIKEADRQIVIPSTIHELYPFLTVIVWQLLSYYIALDLWKDIDKPRNLAKSVTVK